MADKLRNTCKNTGMVEQIHHQAEEHHRWSGGGCDICICNHHVRYE